MVAEMPYADLQSAIDDPPGFRNYWSAEHLTELPDEARRRSSAPARSDMVVPSPSQHMLFPWGGAGRRAAPPTGRCRTASATWVVHPLGLWDDPADDERGDRAGRATPAQDVRAVGDRRRLPQLHRR